MKRRSTTQDISWFLDLYRNDQLDLNPSYQRRSVWTEKDRKYFLDTVFRDYPCPAIFLHKEINGAGKQIYHVVDGKQRLETIIHFVENKIAIDKDFEDMNIAGKKWKNIENDASLKKRFWDYVLPVEFIDTIEGIVINDVFDRLNRNVKKLERQELRHAKYYGWFITKAEDESEKEEWWNLGVVTKARMKRMKDVQFISELLIIILKNRIDGFDQDYIDQIYADYDSPQESISSFSEEDFFYKLELAKKYVLEMEQQDSVVTTYAKGFGDFFSLWAFIVLNGNQLPNPEKIVKKYSEFMEKVNRLSREKNPEQFLDDQKEDTYFTAYKYFRNSVQASTDQSQRQARHEALNTALLS